MNQVTLSRLVDVEAAFRHPALRQALYDEGAVATEGVLLTLYGEAHLQRRRLESRVLKAEVFREYERELVPLATADALAHCVADGRVDAVAFGRRAAFHLTARITGIDVAPGQYDDLLRLVTKFGEGATLVHSKRLDLAPGAQPPEFLGFHSVLSPPTPEAIISRMLLTIELTTVTIAGLYAAFFFRRR